MKKTAFSLIEIGIVILIISIIVAGVIQSSRLVNQIKLITARNSTKTSPVASIKDLVLWLEPTLDESFIENQTDNDYKITQWNDINPQNANKYIAIKNASSAVTYYANGINNIPAIKFTGEAGTSGYFI